jgi:hypothetical protein
VYRAGLSRTLTLVAALPLTAAATGGYARDMRAPDVKAENAPTAQAFCLMGRVIAARHSRPLLTPLFSVGSLAEEKEAVGQARACAMDPDRVDALIVADAVARIRQVE